MMGRLSKLLVVSLGAGPLAACGTGPGACTLDVAPGIVAEIRDAFDDSPIAEGARGAARDGDFVDSLQPYGAVANGMLISRAGAYERAGDYTVTIEHDGYFAWETRVRVEGDDCHVRTENFSVHLQRLP